MRFDGNSIPLGYYWLYMPNALRALRQKLDPEGYARDQASDAKFWSGNSDPNDVNSKFTFDYFSPCHNCPRSDDSILRHPTPEEVCRPDDGHDCPHKEGRRLYQLKRQQQYGWGNDLDINNDIFAQKLYTDALMRKDRPRAFWALRKRTSLFKKLEGHGWSRLEGHYSFFPEIREDVERLIQEEMQRLRHRDDNSRAFWEMPFKLVNEDYDHNDDMWGNPANTRLERLNKELVTDGSCDHYVGLYRDSREPSMISYTEIHSVATPEQILAFKQLIIDNYIKECEQADGHSPKKSLLRAINEF